MLDNYILPFLGGLFIVLIPIALYSFFYFFLLITLGTWNIIEKADSLKKTVGGILAFVFAQLAIIINVKHFVSPDILNGFDVNSSQIISCYLGFVVFIITTRKQFGQKILKSQILKE